jgi:beta-xylosidase
LRRDPALQEVLVNFASPSSRPLLATALVLGALIACAAPAAAPSAADVILEPTVRPTLAEAALATPAAPASAPTAAAAVTELASSAFRDDFDGTMDTGWSWFQSAEPGYSLTHTPGWLRLNLSSGGFRGDTHPENVLVRPAPTGNFSMVTYLRFSPHNNFEFAGLAVVFDDQSVVQFGRAGCFAESPTPGCIGDGLYFDNLQNGSAVGGNFATPALLGLDYRLRLERQANVYTASYSTDGSNWQPIGSHTVDKAPVSIGLIAAQSTVASPYADFDYFEMESQ